MNLPSPTAHPLPTRRLPGAQSGIGLVQVMLILLLVGTALAAGAVLLQSKRAPAQAVAQERTLRWADEAIAAFASANARLPCPSQTQHGVEDCSPGHVKGWLPLRTLLGASGNGLPVGPVAYMVYRGDETADLDLADPDDAAHLDLTAPGNAYQPPLIDGTVREIVTRDDEGEETSRRPFAAINGLDLCRSLELAEAGGTDPKLARVDAQGGVPRNVAYGIAAAGPQAGSSRMDDGNTGVAASLEAPWREWDSGYDDRVRVRTFDGVGQMLGCRLLADLAAPTAAAQSITAPFSAAALAATTAGAGPYNVSLAGMDVLAAAVTLHDSLALLQATNVDATEAAVRSATAAQISLIFKLVTTAASLSDQITTVVTSAVSLTRAIATCIASLGATCWEVPLKAAAVVTSIVALGEKGVTLAQKAAALPFVAQALDASIKARDLARKAAVPPAMDLDEARKQMECTLYARNCEDEEDRQVVYKKDKDGNPVPKLGEDGKPLHDSNGNPLYEVESETIVPRKGLEEQTRIARQEWDTLQQQVDLLEQERLAPWGRGVAGDGNTLLENGRIRERIDARQTCNGSNWQNCPSRYRKTIQEWKCPYVGANQGEYDKRGDDCVHVGTETVKIDDADVTRPAGAYDRVLEIRYEFDWDVAVADAIARRRKAEEWTDLNLREEELKREIKQFQENFDTWFQGDSSILAGMKKQRDDARHCGASPRTEMTEQKCTNASQAVIYIEQCMTPEIGEDGKPVYVVENGRTVPRLVRDTNPLATCKPNMQNRIDELKREQSGLAQRRSDAASAYGNLPSPYVAYPVDWFEYAIEAIEDKDGNPLRYEWKRSQIIETYQVKVIDEETDPPTEKWEDRTRSLPWYAREPYGGSGSAPLLVTGNLELLSKDMCAFFVGRRWNGTAWWWPGSIQWGDTYRMGLYCQRYPYSRAFEDWRRAKVGADNARKNYEDTLAQFEKLKKEYEQLQEAGAPSGGSTIAMGFGAEPALERADARGSTGPQALEAQP